jgi:hypothetical protein
MITANVATVQDCPMLNIVIPFSLHFPAIVNPRVKVKQSQNPTPKLPISITTKLLKFDPRYMVRSDNKYNEFDKIKVLSIPIFLLMNS